MNPSLQHRQHVEHVANQAVTESDTQQLIAGSWRRCLTKHHLNPDKPPSTRVLESQHLKEHTQRHDFLMGVAQQELVDLYNQMQGSGYSIFLTDASGIVLQQVCDPCYLQSMRSAGLRLGADWSEQANGTNGVGTCIVEQRPLTVHLDDHFHTNHTQLSCSAAPIRDSSGELLAVLDSSAARQANPRADQQTLGLVRNTASFIEGLYFLRLHRSDIIVHLGSSPDIVPQPRNPMIAITSNGRITGANERALMVLGAPTRQALFGREIQHVLDLRSCPVNTGSAGQIHQVRMIDRGKLVFATWQVPAPRSSNAIFASVIDEKPKAIAAPELSQEHGDKKLSEEIVDVVELLDQNIAVLLIGETGAGKDTVARALHDASRFRRGDFVAIDCCSATSWSLEKSVRGFATDSTVNAIPAGGTLFLNDANLMSPELQAHLVKSMHQLERSSDLQHPGFNLIAACRDEINSLVTGDKIRNDLYYRLAQYQFKIPPLREREQLEALIIRLLELENQRQTKQIRLSQCALDALLTYSWPGNIRELQSTLRTSMTLCRSGEITAQALPHSFCEPVAEDSTDYCSRAPQHLSDLEAAEYEVLLRELRQSRWNISATAKKIHMSRNTIYRKMEKYGISHDKDAES